MLGVVWLGLELFGVVVWLLRGPVSRLHDHAWLLRGPVSRLHDHALLLHDRALLQHDRALPPLESACFLGFAPQCVLGWYLMLAVVADSV